MVNLPSGREKRERSLTFSGHSKILDHCHQMFRSISTRSSNRNINESNASTNELAASTRRRRSIKKAFSLIFNKADSEICNPPDDTEMHEFIRHTSSEENLNTIQRSPSTVSDNTIRNQRSLFPHSTCANTVHRTLSQLKNKLKCRHQQTDNNREKNIGYLVVVNPDSEPVLLPNDSIDDDHQQTQHAQPCVQINHSSFDLNQIQYTSMTPMTPNLSPPSETLLGPYMPHYDIHSNNEFEVQSTRSSVECGIPQSDFLNIHETRTSQMISTTSSTNSSTHEYTGIDRSTLDDTEYVRAQELDLHRLIDLEINLSNEHHGLQLDLEDELLFNSLYDETLKLNLDLKEELQMLQEEHDQIYSTWSCELCTFLNQPYSETQRDTCDICEGPSPLKRATLIK